jgi:hypothetical protein
MSVLRRIRNGNDGVHGTPLYHGFCLYVPERGRGVCRHEYGKMARICGAAAQGRNVPFVVP